MLTLWKARAQSNRTASDIYGSIVAAARREPFYSEHGVPDTPDGRFAMVVVHSYLVLERLQQEGEPGQTLSRALVDAFVTDMDDCMREMGVGDLTVPRKVKKAAGALYDCAAEFRNAEQTGSGPALAEAVHKTLLPFAPHSTAASVAAYMRRAGIALAACPGPALLSGHVAFVDV